jgi:rhodanese-related sulfurtransferase
MTGAANADKKAYRSPDTVTGAVTVSVQQAKELFDQGVAFLDVRSPRLYAKGHILGTYHLDFKYNFDEEKLASVAKIDQPLVIYCSGVKCSRSYRASEKAVEWGYTKVYYFRGGIVEWKKAGYPIEKGDSAQK